MSRVNITVHFDNEKESGTIGVRTLASVSSKPIAINFNYDVTVWLSEPQLRDLAAKIEAELQDRMAETIKLAAGNPQLIADLKANWQPPNTEAQATPPAKSIEQKYREFLSLPRKEIDFYASPEAETEQQHANQNMENSHLNVDHARANAEQVEMLEKEAKNA